MKSSYFGFFKDLNGYKYELITDKQSDSFKVDRQ